MSNSIDTAVILAAGAGTRLEALGQMIPKGFMRFGELPIVEESILQLVSFGIGRIVIVTGHLDDVYEGLRARYPDLITTVHNPRFATTGSMFSLSLARELIEGDFLLLESDIIYEDRAIPELLAHPKTDVVLLAGATDSSDPIHVEGRDGCLVAMSKDRAAVGDVVGELVGVSKISLPLYAAMVQAMEEALPASMQWHYEEDGLVAAAGRTNVWCHVVDDLAFFEIDDERDLEFARNHVFPKIVDRDRGRPALRG